MTRARCTRDSFRSQLVWFESPAPEEAKHSESPAAAAAAARGLPRVPDERLGQLDR